MRKREKSETIADKLLFIKKSFQIFGNENIEDKEELIKTSKHKIDELIYFFNGLRKLVYFLVIIVLVLLFLLMFSFFYVNEAKNISSEIEDVKTDTIANQILEVKRIMMPDSTFQTSYNYQIRNNKIVSYNQLLKEIDSLEKLISSKNLKINTLENDIVTANAKIDLAQDQYGIRFWNETEIKQKKEIEYINVESKKVDSALILLEAYRKKLHYNKDSKKWEIR
jgi:hypothetical protein